MLIGRDHIGATMADRRWLVGFVGSVAWAFDGGTLALGKIVKASTSQRVRARIATRLLPQLVSGEVKLDSKQATHEAPREALTVSERRCLRYVALSNKEIARRLELSIHSVKRYVDILLHKLGAGSRAEVIVIGLRRGLVDLGDLATLSQPPSRGLLRG